MIVVEIPLRIESMANCSLPWYKKAKLIKSYRNAAILVRKPQIPCQVYLTRIAPRDLDDDNLRGAFKALRDGIADRIGLPDNDPRVQWFYKQERGKPKEYAVRVEIFEG